jgi:beta-lactamase class A
MLRDIVMERGFSRASGRGMLKLLLAQTHNDKLPAGLPADARIAHKTGRITGVEHDAGIVALPDGREYIVVFLSSGLSSAGDGIESARATSRLVFEYEAAAARLTDPRLRLPPIDIRD